VKQPWETPRLIKGSILTMPDIRDVPNPRLGFLICISAVALFWGGILIGWLAHGWAS
jgi:hypothetical protein